MVPDDMHAAGEGGNGWPTHGSSKKSHGDDRPRRLLPGCAIFDCRAWPRPTTLCIAVRDGLETRRAGFTEPQVVLFRRCLKERELPR